MPKEKPVIRTRIAVVHLNEQIALETDEGLDKALKAFDKLMKKYAEKKKR